MTTSRFAVGCVFFLCLFVCATGCVVAGEAELPLYYNAPPPRFGPSKDEQAALDLLNKDRRTGGLAALEWDPILGRLAREHSADMAKGHYFAYESPTLGALSYRLHRAGVSAAFIRQIICEVASLDSVLTQLAKDEHPFHLESDTHIGVGVQGMLIPLGYKVTLIAMRRLAALDPLPMTAEKGQTARLGGRFLGRLNEPRVTVGSPHGAVYDVPVTVAKDGRFTAWIAFDHGTGKYTVQVGGKGEQGPLITDVMHVYVGIPYPRPKAAGAGEQEAEQDPEAVMFRLLNADRVGAGLRPVQLDPRLSAVARAHSRDMADNHFFAHVSPRTGELTDRLKRAGIQLKTSAENISRGRTAAEAEEGLMNSPVHRRNILTPEFEIAGVGIVLDADRVLYAAQVFGQKFPLINTEKAATSLLQGLNAARARKGVAPLVGDPVLDEIALANSRQMLAEDHLGTARVKELLEQKAVRFKSCQVLVFLSGDEPTAERAAKALEAQFDAVGIGLVQGDSRAHGPKMLWTTVVLLQR